MNRKVTLLALWSIYTLGWLVFAALEISAFTLTQGMSLRQAFAAAATVTVPAFLLGFGVWPLTGRVTWERGWGRFIAQQIAFSLVYSALWVAAIAGQLVLTVGQAAALLSLKNILWWQIQFGVIAYTILSSGFYAVRVIMRLRDEQTRRERAEMLQVRAELEALKGKLQPHFLFNILHTVTALVRKDPVKAEEALLKLGEVLRYVLQTKRIGAHDDVPLAEEWAFVRHYLDIEQIRFGSRLRVTAELSDDARDCRVPVFTLQPLVENAIHHAIAPRSAGGEIRIAAAVRDDRLELEISDDGPGTAPAGIQDGPGLGLRTVRQRLETRFPGESTFQVRTAPGEGFSVTLSLPAEELVGA